MGRPWLGTVVMLGCCLSTACVFDSSGAGASGGASKTSSGGDDPSTSTTASSTLPDVTTLDDGSSGGSNGSDGSDGSDTSGRPPTSSTSSSGSTTGGAPEGPVLEISDGDVFDFGEVGLDSPANHEFEVTNVGATAASGVSVDALSAPFSMVATTCGDTVEPEQSCTITVVLDPEEFGAAEATVQVTHDDGTAQRPMTGTGVGTVRVPLENPGGEDPSVPPNGWMELQGNDWQTYNVLSYEGERCLFGGSDAPNQEHRLGQDVDVSQWASLIDQNEITMTFSGFIANYDVDDDPARLAILFLDDAGNPMGAGVAVGQWQSSNQWMQQEIEEAAPAGARFVRVRLDCNKVSGDAASCFYDELVLTATYDP